MTKPVTAIEAQVKAATPVETEASIPTEPEAPQLAIPEAISSKAAEAFSSEASPQVPSTSPLRSPSATEQTDFEQAQADIVAHQALTTIEADDAPDDALDPGYESDHNSLISASITSSVRNYAFENGRRYHKFREGRYLFPNDESEQDLADMNHAMILNLCGGKLHFAPLADPQNILDVGTGTGIWAIDAGDEYPSAQVLGIDLSPIQPAFVPPNVRFMVDDAESPWLHVQDKFDLVHFRQMNSSIKQWPPLLSQAYKHIKPGGWIELQEYLWKAQCDDGTMSEDYIVDRFFQLIKQAILTFGIDGYISLQNPQMLRDAGFVNVKEQVFKVPIGIWPKHKTMRLIGAYMRTFIYDRLQAISLRPLVGGLKWTVDEVEEFLVHVRKGLMDASTHSYMTFHVTYGQKPADP